MEYKVRFKRRYKVTLSNITDWCNKNSQGKWMYQYTAPVIWFEKSEDAMMFKLMLPAIERMQTESRTYEFHK